MKVKRSLELFKEVITPDNVEPMSEIVAIFETKYLIRWVGTTMIYIHRNLMLDVFNKNQADYVLNDSYDLVQQVALLLCENIGKKLSDTHHIDKKGRVVTIQMQAFREIEKITNYKCRHMKKDISFEAIQERLMPVIEINEDDNTHIEETEIDVESLIENLGLNEKYLAVLKCRLNGMSFPQIAKVIQRAISTSYDYYLTIQRRYQAIYG